MSLSFVFVGKPRTFSTYPSRVRSDANQRQILLLPTTTASDSKEIETCAEPLMGDPLEFEAEPDRPIPGSAHHCLRQIPSMREGPTTKFASPSPALMSFVTGAGTCAANRRYQARRVAAIYEPTQIRTFPQRNDAVRQRNRRTTGWLSCRKPVVPFESYTGVGIAYDANQ
jgi:hypothetical protein